MMGVEPTYAAWEAALLNVRFGSKAVLQPMSALCQERTFQCAETTSEYEPRKA